MKKCFTAIVLGLLLSCLPSAGQVPGFPTPFPTQANPTPPPNPPGAATTTESREIRLTEVPDHLERALAIARRITQKAAGDSADELSARLPNLALGLRKFAAESRRKIAENTSVPNVEIERGLWSYANKTLSGWQATTFTKSKALEKNLLILKEESVFIARAKEQFAAQQSQSGITATIARVEEQIAQATKAGHKRQSMLLSLQTGLTELEIEAGMVEEDLREASATARSQLLRLDNPPIWKSRSAATAESSSSGELEKEFSGPAMLTALRFFLGYLAGLAGLHLATYILFLTPLLLLRKQTPHWKDSSESWQRNLYEVMQRPYSAALLPSFIVSGILLRDTQLQSVLLIFPLIRVLPIYMRVMLKQGTWLLAGLFVFDWFQRSYIPSAPMFARILGLIEIVLTLLALSWLRKRLKTVPDPTSITRMWIIGATVGQVLLLIASLSMIVGAVALARYLETGVVTTLYGGALLHGFVQVCDGFFQLFILSNAPLTGTASSLRLPADVAKKLLVGMNWLSMVFFLLLTVGAFRLTDPFLAFGRTALSQRFSIGAVDFTLNSLFIVIVALTGASLLSRIIRFFLSAGVYGRFDLQRGTGEVISKLLHYTLLTAAFLFALSATGIDLNRFTILVGALGVGLGFGLQNIVSNFICGLILLFERPLAVGDTVDVHGVTGTVTDIGIRATRIRTWDNADVAVPNSNLVSGQFTNWKTANARRGSQMVIGVAMGTDPQQVIRILQDVASHNPLILTMPLPEAFFTGLTENSMAFTLRYWSLVRDKQKVDSDMYTAVCQRLTEEGIDMPRAQRELYLRDTTARLEDVKPAERSKTA